MGARQPAGIVVRPLEAEDQMQSTLFCIPVAVAYECPIVRRGLVAALGEAHSLSVRFDATHGAELLQMCGDDGSAVVFASVRAGMDIARGTADRAPSAKLPVVVVSPDLGELDARDALQMGVKGLLLLDTNPSELLDCARQVLLGGRYITRPLASVVAQQVCTEALTEREQDVLNGIHRGCCNKTIARELGIGVGTVKTHVKGVLAKLHVASRTEAAAVAARRGLVRLTGALPDRGRCIAPGRRTAGSAMPLPS
jgi:DNA-binding NarL/FixJ family response regulator